jgi:hypothetical protein
MLPRILLAVILLVFLYLGWSVGASPQDDAFISFRYARHLAAGDGPVFNPGERVEGYTCFLWVVLIAGAMKAGLDPLLFCRIAGLASGALLICLFYLIGKRISGGHAWWPLLTPVHLAVAGPVVIESVQGMETVFFSLLVAAGIYFVLFKAGTAGGLLASSLFFSAAFLTRPEGALFFVLSLFYLSITRRQAGPLVYFAAPFALTAAAHTAWRLYYYGALLPATFHAKVGREIEQLRRGWHYFKAFSRDIGIWRYLPAGLALFLAGRGEKNGIRGKPLAFIFMVVILSWLYVICVGGDYKFTFRFFVPAFGFFLILFQEGCRLIAARLRAGLAGRLIPALVLIFAVMSVTDFYAAFKRTWGFAGARRKIWRQEMEIGLWLKRNSPPGAGLATGAAGIVPYFSGLTTIDMAGLTDPHISRVPMEPDRRRLPGHEKGDGRYVLERAPDYILFQNITRTKKKRRLEDIEGYFRSPPRHGFSRSEEELWHLPAFHQRYALRSVRFKHFHFNYFRKRHGAVH